MPRNRKDLHTIGYRNMGPYVAPQEPTDAELGIIDDHVIERDPSPVHMMRMNRRSASKIAIGLCAIERGRYSNSRKA